MAFLFGGLGLLSYNLSYDDVKRSKRNILGVQGYLVGA